MAVWGVILAGGLARRMGGGDKGLRLVGGRPVLGRVIDCLAPQVAGLVINANDAKRLAGFGLPLVEDGVPGRPGPLAGVLAGLDWVAAHAPGCTAIVTAPCDAPFLPGDLVQRLAASGGPACAASGGRLHPVVALWPVGMRAAVRRAVADGVRRVGTLLHGAIQVEWPSVPLDPFFNVNTPEDLAEADRLGKTELY